MIVHPLLGQGQGTAESRGAIGLIQRVIGDRSRDFVLQKDFSDEKNDAFRVISANGRVTIKGNSTMALTRGFYHFLKNACNSQIAWSGEHVDLPKEFPDYDSRGADSGFWDKKSARALLSRVPDDRMIVIDLAEEMFQGWKKHDAFYGKPWIYSIIHNFGGHNNLFGDLNFVARDPAAVLGDPNKGHLVGFGLSPEGIENNEVVYELLTDVTWSNKKISIRDWLRDFCASRYGDCPAEMEEAWSILLDVVYGTFDGTMGRLCPGMGN